MKQIKSTDQIAEAVRAEISKYASGPFSDNADLIRDVHLAGDDLTAAALSIEQKLGVRLERFRYSEIHTINDLVRALEATLERGPAGRSG